MHSAELWHPVTGGVVGFVSGGVSLHDEQALIGSNMQSKKSFAISVILDGIKRTPDRERGFSKASLASCSNQ
jgi:hypothetical protein